MPALGECDIKWTRWFEKYGDGIASSTDGDFIPIALMNHEAHLRTLVGGVPSAPYKVAIYRGEYRMPSAAAKITGKRKSSDGAENDAAKIKIPNKKVGTQSIRPTTEINGDSSATLSPIWPRFKCCICFTYGPRVTYGPLGHLGDTD